jgi:ssDNA-binding Zn-finger/Zn-ribbon topoisomerase 1
MQTGIACPRCGTTNIKTSRKTYKMITPTLSLRLWQCEECPSRFIIANVLVKDKTAERLEDLYEQESTKGIH